MSDFFTLGIVAPKLVVDDGQGGNVEVDKPDFGILDEGLPSERRWNDEFQSTVATIALKESWWTRGTPTNYLWFARVFGDKQALMEWDAVPGNIAWEYRDWGRGPRGLEQQEADKLWTVIRDILIPRQTAGPTVLLFYANVEKDENGAVLGPLIEGSPEAAVMDASTSNETLHMDLSASTPTDGGMWSGETSATVQEFQDWKAAGGLGWPWIPDELTQAGRDVVDQMNVNINFSYFLDGEFG